MNLKELAAYLKRPDKSKYVTLRGSDKLKEYNLYINGRLVSSDTDKINAAPYLNNNNNVLKVAVNYKKDDFFGQRQSKIFEVASMFPEGSESCLLIEQTPEQFAAMEYPLRDISIIETPDGLTRDSVYVSLVNKMYKNVFANEFINRKIMRDSEIFRNKEEGVIFITDPIKPGRCPREDVKFLANKLGIQKIIPPILNYSIGYHRTFDFKKETDLVSCMLKMKEGASFVAENYPDAVVCLILSKYNGQAIDGAPFKIISKIKRYLDEEVKWGVKKEEDVEIIEMKLALGNSKYENMADKLLETYGLEFSN